MGSPWPSRCSWTPDFHQSVLSPVGDDGSQNLTASTRPQFSMPALKEGKAKIMQLEAIKPRESSSGMEGLWPSRCYGSPTPIRPSQHGERSGMVEAEVQQHLNIYGFSIPAFKEGKCYDGSC